MKKVKLLSLILVFALLITIAPMSVAADSKSGIDERGFASLIDLSLLDVERYQPTDAIDAQRTAPYETRAERHERLLSEGCVLEEMRVVEVDYGTEPTRGLSLECRAVSSTYTQPIITDTKNANQVLSILDNLNSVIMTIVSFVPKVGWIPTLLGVDVTNITDFLSRGKVQYREAATLRYYDVDVREVGTQTWFFSASSQQLERAISVTTIGYKANGSPFTETKSKNFTDTSPYYGQFYPLSETAKYYYEYVYGNFYYESAPIQASYSVT